VHHNSARMLLANHPILLLTLLQKIEAHTSACQC
jgi:hypothetical protein